MALTYKTRRRLSLLILLVGMPAYIAVAWWVMSLFERPGIWLEFAIYIVLGILWVLPFKAVFKGVGQADPDAPRDDH
ncbi:DUF2842 domain-containing protein [Roseicyclus sp.]|jgi:predicted membrane channel-forming protein YqfA (hemolysin III family)|uniref:DUF2842 domain-containing protein n=1 Tax=Roseicyclus sp. TaxID=1914329 RepID=UPI003BAEBDA9|nr:DUF2842 domain-containing protein [Pseudomonadota bacterium]